MPDNCTNPSMYLQGTSLCWQNGFHSANTNFLISQTTELLNSKINVNLIIVLIQNEVCAAVIT